MFWFLFICLLVLAQRDLIKDLTISVVNSQNPRKNSRLLFISMSVVFIKKALLHRKNGNLNHSHKWGSLMLFEKKIFERLDFSSINNKLNFTRLFFLMILFSAKKPPIHRLHNLTLWIFYENGAMLSTSVLISVKKGKTRMILFLQRTKVSAVIYSLNNLLFLSLKVFHLVSLQSSFMWSNYPVN